MDSNKDFQEIELSILFGKRFVAYEKEVLNLKIKNWGKSDIVDQHYQKDRSVIIPLIRALEVGEAIAPVSFYKKMMTVAGKDFFKKEFKVLNNFLAVS